MCVMPGVSSSLTVEPSWCVSPQGAWHTAWLCQCGLGCVGVVAPLCRISTPVPLISPSHTQPHTRIHTLTLFSCSITDTTYCLPPTGVNLSTVKTLPKNKVYQVTAVSWLCATLFVCFIDRKSVKYEYSVCFCAYVMVVFLCACMCVCIGCDCVFSGGLAE